MPHTTACAVAAAGRSVRIRAWAVVGVLLLAALTDALPRGLGARAVSAARSHQEDSPTAPAITPTPTAGAVGPSPTAEVGPITPTAATASPTAEPPAPEATPSPTEPSSPTAELPTPLAQPLTPTETRSPTPPADTPEPPTQPLTPTETLDPTLPPTPAATSTPYAGDPPLELALRASGPQVAPGGSLSYQLQLGSTSATPHGVLVLTKLDPHLTAVSVSASNGICQLGPVVVCNVSVQRGQAVSMQIDLRVRADVQPGQVLVSQASARDTAYNAASSEPVRVTVIAPQGIRPGAPAEPTAPPSSAAPSSPSPTPGKPRPSPNEQTPADSGQIAGTVIDLSSGAPAPGVRVQIGETTVRSDASGNYGLQGLAPGTYRIELALEPGQGDPAQQPLTLTLGPGAVLVQHLMFRSSARPTVPSATHSAPDPATPEPRPERTSQPPPKPQAERTFPPQTATLAQASVTELLPDTASVPAAAVAALTLVAVALLLRSLRRVYQAAALLADQSDLAAQLGPLLRAAQRRQRRLRKQIEEGLRVKG